MTDFMTVFPEILVKASQPGYLPSKGFQLRSTCHLFQESHKPQVWLCFLVLSLLSTSTCAAPGAAKLAHLQSCLGTEYLKKAIEENCKMMSLKCYILELRMVIVEEVGSENPKTHCVMDFNERLPDLDNGASAYPVDCPPCEAYSLKNITVFMERLNSLLQELNSMQT
uniref:Interleukin n=1 Tax=Gasterosteus aculeatus aculeatus TaxID=481459 RepID=G3PYW5_GASAC